ncbi:MAG TPA: nucleoside hydrolase-like domain-containing protein [Roseomonas sp.]
MAASTPLTSHALSRRRILCGGMGLAALPAMAATAKPRVFVTTDAGGSDKDDMQSLVHLLLYSDDLDILGLGSAAAKLGFGNVAAINSAIAAYEKDLARLRTHSAGYPSATRLRSLVREGSSAVQPAAGFSRPTHSSQAIIAAARTASPARPLWVLTWGSHGDVAQALHDDPAIAPNIRLISSGVDGQDPNAHRYLLSQWKGRVWWISGATSGRGIYAPPSGANTPDTAWPGPNARGHGALGDFFMACTRDLYGDFDGTSSTDGLKMGDTFSVLYLIDPNRDPNDPTARGWGGSFVADGPLYWTDSRDPALAYGSYHGAKTVADHKAVFLAGFAARLDRAQAAKARPVTPTRRP